MIAAASPTAQLPRLITRGCAWLRPSESLWAICHKITHLNYMQIGDWQDLLFDGQRPHGLQSTSLVAWKHVPQARLAQVLGVVSHDLDYATTECLQLQSDYGGGRDTDWQRSMLQYCPACIAQGFHSSLHQLRCLDQCPWHALKLRRKCAHGEWISCDWSPANLARPFCCRHGESLWPGLTADRWSPRSEATEPGYASQLLTWLDSLRSMDRQRDVVGDVRGHIGHRGYTRELELEMHYRSGPDWHTQDADTTAFLAAITDGPAWLRSTGTVCGAGDTVRESRQVDPTLLARIEAPRLPLRIPAIDSLPPTGSVDRRLFPDGKHPYHDIGASARNRFLARLDAFQDAFAEHIARCPAEACVTDATPGGGCLLRRTTGAFELARANGFHWTEAYEGGEEVTTTFRLKYAVERVLERQFEQALLWLGLAWRDLATVSHATLQLLRWICDQAATGLARNFAETLLLDLSEAQSGTGPGGHRARQVGHRPAPLPEQRRYREFDLNPNSSPFALLSRAPGEVTFCAYHRISTQQWLELARSGWLCESLGRGPVPSAAVTDTLVRLGVADPRFLD